MNDEMKTALEKYMQPNGYYDTLSIRKDNGYSSNAARFFDIFGGSDDQPEEMSELLAAAETYNNEKIEQETCITQAKKEQEIIEVLSAEDMDWQKALELGIAEIVGDVATPETSPYYKLYPEYGYRRAALTFPAYGETVLSAVISVYGEQFPVTVAVSFTNWNGTRRIVSVSDVRLHTCVAKFEDGSESGINPNSKVTVSEVDLLAEIMTPAEIECEYNLPAGTVRQAIRRGNFRLYRQPDQRTYLIRRTDAKKQWSK